MFNIFLSNLIKDSPKIELHFFCVITKVLQKVWGRKFISIEVGMNTHIHSWIGLILKLGNGPGWTIQQALKDIWAYVTI
jgi:hypothetical protein